VNEKFPQDWYDWVFPFNREYAADYEKRTAFGKSLSILGIPFVAVASIGFVALFLLFSVTLYPFLLIEENTGVGRVCLYGNYKGGM